MFLYAISRFVVEIYRGDRLPADLAERLRRFSRELKKDVRFGHFNAKNVPARLKRQKRDPWEEFFSVRQSLTAAMMGTGSAKNRSATRRRRASSSATGCGS